MADHLAADVWRWAVARRAAREVLYGTSPKAGGVTTQRIGRTEIKRVSAASGDVDAMKSLARKRSQVHVR